MVFAPSEFAHPVSSFNTPVVPPSHDPTDGNTATIHVACEWLPYIRGALFQLMLQSTWKGTPDEISLAQDRALQLIGLFQGADPCDCNEPCPQIPAGIDCGDDNMGCGGLVFENGILKCNCCGTLTPIPGQIPGGSQPANGSPQPAKNGGNAIYSGCLAAGGQWLIPAPLSTGDTVDLSNLSGAWDDFSVDGPIWRGPQGLQYFAGVYIPGTIELNGADPLPTAPHMSLVLKLGSTYFDLSSGPVTIPGGYSNATGVLLANEATTPPLTYGSVCFDLTVVNNQAGAWAHDLLFADSSWGAVLSTVAVGPAGVYVPGTGFEDASFQDGVGQYYQGVRINLPDLPGGYHITKFDALIGLTAPNPSPAPHNATSLEILAHSGASTIVAFNSITPGDPQHLVLSGLSETHSDLFIAVQSGYGGGSPPTAGIAHIYSLHIEGTGVDPYP